MRSRVAAQILKGNGFNDVYNLAGGIKGTNGPIAVGPIEQGLGLFDGHESVEDVLVIGFGLEQGLREFYLSMEAMVASQEVKKVLKKLGEVEILHQKRLLGLYREVTGRNISFEEMSERVVQPAMEGGLSTEEFLQLYSPDLESTVGIISLAMSIEAQALDLYQRASMRTRDANTSKTLAQIAAEEHEHLRRLSEVIDSL